MTWLGYVVMGGLLFACFRGFKRGFIKEVVAALFVVLSIAVSWFINPYVNDFLKESTPVYTTIQNTCAEFVDSKKEEINAAGQEVQTSLLDALALPDFLKSSIKENNTAETYQYLAVDTFVEYLSGTLAMLAVNGLSYGISFLLATILIRVASYALDILARLPIISGVNRIAGAFVGGAKGLIYLWLALFIVTVLCSTQFGEMILQMVEQDVFLSFIYERNIFIRIFMNIV